MRPADRTRLEGGTRPQVGTRIGRSYWSACWRLSFFGPTCFRFSCLDCFVFLLERFDSGIRSSRFVYFCVLLVCFLFRIFSCPLCACVCVSFSLIHSVFFICLFRLDRFVGEPKALVVVVKASELFPAFVVCLFLLHFIRSPICFAPVKTKLTNHKKKRQKQKTNDLHHPVEPLTRLALHNR